MCFVYYIQLIVLYCVSICLAWNYLWICACSLTCCFFLLRAPMKSDFLLFMQSDSPVELCCDEPPSNEPPWDCKQYSDNISSFLEQCLLVVGISHQKWSSNAIQSSGKRGKLPIGPSKLRKSSTETNKCCNNKPCLGYRATWCQKFHSWSENPFFSE